MLRPCPDSGHRGDCWEGRGWSLYCCITRTQIFGTDRFCAGIPSNLEAMSADDCSTLHHTDFHILGRVVMTDDLVQKIDALKANNPDANYTADANWLRARTRKISIEASALTPDRSNGLGDTKRTRAVRNILQQEAYYSLLA